MNTIDSIPTAEPVNINNSIVIQSVKFCRSCNKEFIPGDIGTAQYFRCKTCSGLNKDIIIDSFCNIQ